MALLTGHIQYSPGFVVFSVSCFSLTSGKCRIDLPHKPIPYQGALCLIAILLCWLQIQDKTSQKLGIHKDHGFLNTVFLLFFQYNVLMNGDMLEHEN